MRVTVIDRKANSCILKAFNGDYSKHNWSLKVNVYDGIGMQKIELTTCEKTVHFSNGDKYASQKYILT